MQLQIRHLAEYFFPQPDVNRLNFDDLIDVICARDQAAAAEMREFALNENFLASSEFR